MGRETRLVAELQAQARPVLALRDSRRSEGFDYEREAEITLEPGQSFVVDFRAEMGGFLFFGNES